MHFKFLALAALSALSTGVQASGLNATINPARGSALKPLSLDWLQNDASAEGQLVSRQGSCDSGETECNGGCCLSGRECCGERCCFSGATCIDEKAGICCSEGEEKCGDGCFDPSTEVCCDDPPGSTCQKSAPDCCGLRCCYEGTHCEDGECVEGDHGPGSKSMLPAASIATVFGGVWAAWWMVGR